MRVIEISASTEAMTDKLQKAMDEMSNDGGGIVRLLPGEHCCGMLRLRSNITLEIPAGAVLKASCSPSDFPKQQSPVLSRMDLEPRAAFLYAEQVENFTLTGHGTIDAGGGIEAFQDNIDNSPNRPYGLLFVDCRNIRLFDVSLRNSAFWMQRYFHCNGVYLRGINVWNHANLNNDGIDIDCSRNVRIADCVIDSMDDGICMKTEGFMPTRDVTVTNCIIGTHASAIKLGTGSLGDFENIVVSNCVVRKSEAETVRHAMGASGGLAAIDIASVDGARIRNVIISDLVVDGVETPVYIMLGNRLSRSIRRNYTAVSEAGEEVNESSVLEAMEGVTRELALEEPGESEVGGIDGVTISNLSARNVGPIASCIYGHEGYPIRNLTLRNIDIRCGRSGSEDDLNTQPCWAPSVYPCNRAMQSNLPVFGMALRYIERLKMEHVSFTPAAGECRPALMKEFCTDY